jgi:hypothetical protein
MVAVSSDAPGEDPGTGKEPRAAHGRRRVSDDILQAFHFACDTRDLDVAQALLKVLENLLVERVGTTGSQRSRELAPLVAAHERLWALKQPRDY